MSHRHDWSDWTRWIYYAGGNQDFRERCCKTCPETEEQPRVHQHRYSDGAEVCDACFQPKR